LIELESYDVVEHLLELQHRLRENVLILDHMPKRPQFRTKGHYGMSGCSWWR